MAGVIEQIVVIFNSFMDTIPSWASASLSLFFFALLISVIALFIWKFYRTVSQKDFVNLNLRQYNHLEHPVLGKFFASVLYFLENVLITPLLILIWFAGLSIVILLIAPERAVGQILFISTAMISAIRMLAYSNHEISKDLAKLFPFITLSIFILTPGEFNLGAVISKTAEIPSLFGQIVFFVLFVFILETVLRLFHTFNELWRSGDPGELS